MHIHAYTNPSSLYAVILWAFHRPLIILCAFHWPHLNNLSHLFCCLSPSTASFSFPYRIYTCTCMYVRENSHLKYTTSYMDLLLGLTWAYYQGSLEALHTKHVYIHVHYTCSKYTCICTPHEVHVHVAWHTAMDRNVAIVTSDPPRQYARLNAGTRWLAEPRLLILQARVCGGISVCMYIYVELVVHKEFTTEGSEAPDKEGNTTPLPSGFRNRRKLLCQ